MANHHLVTFMLRKIDKRVKKRVRELSWEKTVGKTLQVYKEAPGV